jgi:hypothetical protein
METYERDTVFQNLAARQPLHDTFFSCPGSARARANCGCGEVACLMPSPARRRTLISHLPNECRTVLTTQFEGVFWEGTVYKLDGATGVLSTFSIGQDPKASEELSNEESLLSTSTRREILHFAPLCSE